VVGNGVVKPERSDYPSFHSQKLGSVNFSLPFTLQMDASNVGVGAVLSQPDEEGYDYPVAYFSRKLHPREQKFSVQ